MRTWSRTSYLAATAALTAAGATTAAARGWGSTEAVVAGLGTAWLLQAPSFWRLAGRLARNEPAVRDWVGGMALRLGGLALIAVVDATTGLPGRDAAVAYVAALLAHLGLEAVWLLQRQPSPGGRDGGAEEGPDDERENETEERAAGGRTAPP